jgi:hypothetical protein
MRDYGFATMTSLITAIAVWLLLMPIVPRIAGATMRRFHLRSSSFVGFAAQFPIPAMYNFSNRSDVKDVPPGFIDPLFGELALDDQFRTINHFPARDATFATGRYRNLKDRRDHWFTLESSYRGQTIRSELHLEHLGDGGYRMHRSAAP